MSSAIGRDLKARNGNFNFDVQVWVKFFSSLPIEEGTSCALSYKKFRGPRNYSGRGWEGGAVGTLVITQRTLYVQFPYMILCDQPIDKAVQHLELHLDSPKKRVFSRICG